MKINWRKHPMMRRMLVTLGIIFIYVIGRYIPLPYVLSGESNTSLVGLFSLGLGPMMYASLLNQLFYLGRRRKIQSPKAAAFRQNTLMLLIALIQGLGTAIGLVYLNPDRPLQEVFQLAFLLAVGAIVLSWFSSMNSAYGVGGQMVLMLSAIILGQFQQLPVLTQLWQNGRYALIVGMLLWAFVTVYVIVSMEKAEYRIAIQRLAIHNRYAEQSYLPLKVNIAGGMPLMYAYTFLTLPQSFLMLVIYLAPKWQWLAKYQVYLTTTHPYGVIIYMIIIVVLSLLLAFVNVDVTRLAEDLRQVGDYIPGIRPGKATQAYLSRYVRFFAWFNGFYLAILAGVPLVLTLGDQQAQALAGLISVVMMLSGLVLNVLEELHVMQLKKQYRSLFE